MSRRIEDLEPDTQQKCRRFLQAAEAAGLRLVVVHTLRTFEEQDLIYQQGRTRPGPIFTNARPGMSWHNWGRALDFAFRKGEKGVTWEGPWEKVGEIAESCGLKWGGRWSHPDRPHVENPHPTKKLRELIAEREPD